MTNSVDPDQLASLFAKAGHVVFSKRRVKALIAAETDDIVVFGFVFFREIKICHFK